MAMAVANRYARALADVVAPTRDYRAILAQLEDFTAAYEQSAELRELLETPAVGLAEKNKVLGAILARLSASPVISNFLRVLTAHYRMPLLREVVRAFRRMAYARLGIVEVKILSADDLSGRERKALQERFRELTRQQVELEFQLDERLLGGILAQIGSTVYDASIRGQLDRIAEQLTGKI